MTLSQVRERVVDVIKEELCLDDINVDIQLSYYAMESIDALSIFYRLQTEFDLDLNDLRSARDLDQRSVSWLSHNIHKRLEEKWAEKTT